MTILKIIKAPDKRLNKKAMPVTQFDDNLKSFAADLIETCYKHDNMAAFASIQMEDDARFSYNHLPEGFRSQPNVIACIFDGEFILVNPEIIEFSDEKVTADETCGSVPNLAVPVSRSISIKVKFQDLNGKEHIQEFHRKDNYSAIYLQHEIDHQNGILSINRANPFQQALLWKKYEQNNRLAMLHRK